MGKRWIRIAESIGDRIVDRRLKPIELSYKLPVPKLSRPRPAVRPTMQVPAIVQRIRVLDVVYANGTVQPLLISDVRA